MRATRLFQTAACAVALCLFASGTAADKVMVNVPDWNQPNAYAAATPGLNNGDCPQWCSPTAAADLMGYWDNVKGCAGLTDGQPPTAFPSPPNQNPCWQQNLWHDGTVELGWFMNTGLWQGMGPPPMFPPKAGVTNMNLIGPGAVAYAMGGWNDPNGAVKVAFPNAANSKDNAFNAQMWANYKAEIDGNRPVLVTFEYWMDVSQPPPGTIVVDGQTVEIWPLNPLGTAHTTCGVGYRDPTPLNPWNGDEEMIVQDDWSTTGQYVLAPIWAAPGWWLQNDYIFVPEPMTVGLLLVGGAVLIRRRK